MKWFARFAVAVVVLFAAMTMFQLGPSRAQGPPGDDEKPKNLKVLPNNHGPQTDRLIYGLGPFKGYDSGDPTSREVGLYDQPFVDTFIHSLANGGRDYGKPGPRKGASDYYGAFALDPDGNNIEACYRGK